jgi:hypothetical protein
LGQVKCIFFVDISVVRGTYGHYKESADKKVRTNETQDAGTGVFQYGNLKHFEFSARARTSKVTASLCRGLSVNTGTGRSNKTVTKSNEPNEKTVAAKYTKQK